MLSDELDWAGRFLQGADGVLRFDRRDAWGFCTYMDLFGCERGRIGDLAVIRDYVSIICDLIGSDPVGPPQIIKFGKGDKFGYSFTQLVSTSSITGHFQEQRNDAYIDVFFCQIYDPNRVVEMTQRYFGAKDMKVKLFTRG